MNRINNLQFGALISLYTGLGTVSVIFCPVLYDYEKYHKKLNYNNYLQKKIPIK